MIASIERIVELTVHLALTHLKRDAGIAAAEQVPENAPTLAGERCAHKLEADLWRRYAGKGPRPFDSCDLGCDQRLMRHQNRKRHARKQVACGTTEHELAQPGVAVASHDQQVGLRPVTAREEGIARVAVARCGSLGFARMP
jgi:hypothetical protein